MTALATAHPASADEHTEHPHITKSPGVRFGRPVIRGTGVPVWLIASFYKAGKTVDDVLLHYPDLKAAWVHDAISYYLDHTADIEKELRENRPEYLIEKRKYKVDERGILRFPRKANG
jgi:uncharacterized protein (DUF433 family)